MRLTQADLHAWPVLAPLAIGYVPWSSGAMRPAGLVAVLNDVWVHERRAVLECGGGVSTVFLARLLGGRGGRLVTLEHDERWAELLARQLEREGLDAHARVVHAPLEPHPLDLGCGGWYARGAVDAALDGADVELLVVDGPPADEPGTEWARYPALPALRERLAAECTVVLDDIHRPGEREILARWETETDVRFERREDDGGIAIGRPGRLRPLGP